MQESKGEELSLIADLLGKGTATVAAAVSSGDFSQSMTAVIQNQVAFIKSLISTGGGSGQAGGATDAISLAAAATNGPIQNTNPLLRAVTTSRAIAPGSSGSTLRYPSLLGGSTRQSRYAIAAPRVSPATAIRRRPASFEGTRHQEVPVSTPISGVDSTHRKK